MNNEEKILAMLELIQQEQKEMREQLETVRASQLKVELEQYPRISAALDGFSYNRDKNEQLGERVTDLENKADRHDIRIGALELAKAE